MDPEPPYRQRRQGTPANGRLLLLLPLLTLTRTLMPTLTLMLTLTLPLMLPQMLKLGAGSLTGSSTSGGGGSRCALTRPSATAAASHWATWRRGARCMSGTGRRQCGPGRPSRRTRRPCSSGGSGRKGRTEGKAAALGRRCTSAVLQVVLLLLLLLLAVTARCWVVVVDLAIARQAA